MESRSIPSTIRDAHVREFEVTVLTDGYAAFSRMIHDEALAGLRPIAKMTSVADFLETLS